MSLTQLALWALLQGVVVFVTARIVPGITVKSYGTAIGVAAVYGLASFFLKWLLVLLSLPLIIVTFGLFLLVVNGMLLWITDKIVPGFEIKGFTPLAVGTVLITAGGMLVNAIVR